MGADALVLDPEELARRLAALGQGAVLCVHQAELGEPAAIPGGVLLVLGAIGLLAPLAQRIPSCVEHDCALVARCQYVADFAREERSRSERPKSGRKFRVTEATFAFVEDPSLLATLLVQHPVARWLAERFAERAAWTPFALAEAWLAAAQEAAARPRRSAGGAAEATPDFDGSRRELAGCIALLVGLGHLAWQREGLLLRLARPWW
ncbi:hypothetical protein OO015_11385 [Thermomicrobium sp. 4228-Ro]|uniref:hypothetical protein n=1 Tax=Thermomicrobium sp. 4228-Ro TaxID=2993937 RepID=UPI0022495663|nr:hypothetical protein [Thermomicrobium sp. 4228-Ro]MCX2728092.1 hypothetical protein [Thermomicrobium sp. 4228-Ro]